MKKILGLDLGTNSIGWAVLNAEILDNGNIVMNKIEAAGSRILPMDASTLSDFDRGNSISQTAIRTKLRNSRHLRERFLLRRERLHRVLDIIGFLPSHYSKSLTRFGKFKDKEEPKLAWNKNNIDKNEFIFIDSYNEMLNDFRRSHAEFEKKKIPYDWTIYFLRKKALSKKISKEELAWILLNFNQKRGYYQLKNEKIENENDTSIESIKVIDVTKGEKDKKSGKFWYNVFLENGLIYKTTSYNNIYSWKSDIKDFIIKKSILKDGTINYKLSIIPSFDEIETMSEKERNKLYDKIKIKTEKSIIETNKTVGAYIYDSILKNPKQKVRGKLIRTIERSFYKQELKRILEKQTEFHPELQNKDLYKICIEELYHSNEIYRQNIINKNFTYLFLDDIIFYQRPLKTKKSLINNCSYEEHIVIDKATGEERKYGLKCIPKYDPLYQEFRLWQFLKNLRIYKKGLSEDQDVTSEFIKTEDNYVKLFKWLNDKDKVSQKTLLTNSIFNLGKDAKNYRWNYVEDKEYPCNETRAKILSHLSKATIKSDFLTIEIEKKLSHILYSIDDKQELEKALIKFAKDYNLSKSFIDIFKKFPSFPKEYGTYSAKAIKKLLPLMRMGEYWNENNIDHDTRIRIENIINGEYDENIKNRVREKTINFTNISSFKGLPIWLACYIVYNRHSEAKDVSKWKTPNDLQKYLDSFKQHSLRNPIVEQVILETLRTVRDIWKQYGDIDEIHVELGREIKNPADKRKKITQQISDNENTNLRIKALLTEFINPEFEIENVHPYSPNQQEILRIYEEGVFNGNNIYKDNNEKEFIENILKKFKENDIKKRPTRSEILKYKLWLEQKYRSPYTGQIIPLAKLFTPAYEIEHIIPRSRYFDDSLSNKVICESVVNARPYKDNQLGYEFIKNNQGRIVTELSTNNKTVKIFTSEEYEQFVKDNYANNRTKMRKLLMDSIPDDFIARQLNDSRYISKVIKSLLSNIVREEGEEDATSKNIVICTGGITDRLKHDWGINDIWNKIILPRFIRLNSILETSHFTTKTTNGHEIPSIPLEYQKGFNKKRIDHRHHAMDAMVIACANRNIVNYLNNEAASSKSKISRYDLQKLLCDKVIDNKGNYKWIIKKPWETYTLDVYNTLKNIIVSFKQNLRIINKASNVYTHFDNKKKCFKKQAGTNWAIRKSMHTDTIYGEVNLRKTKTITLNEAIKDTSRIVDKELKNKINSLLKNGYNEKEIKKHLESEKDIWQDINLSKISVYYFTKETKYRYFASRKTLDVSFNRKKIEENITDTGIQQILLRHLENNANDPKIAFSPEGIDEMNKRIIQINNGKFHQPIFKVRYYESGNRFAVGKNGNKPSKYVEADKGTNLYFAIYETEKKDKNSGKIIKERKYTTIPLNLAIERLKEGLSPAPKDENGNEPKFVLSPNDIVYVPKKIENLNIDNIKLNQDRIYKFVSCTGNEAHFIPINIASPILDKDELGSNNKAQRAWTGEMIKDICIPIKLDRLGNIIKIGN